MLKTSKLWGLGIGVATVALAGTGARGSFLLVDNFQESLGTQTWLGEVATDPMNPANTVAAGNELAKMLLPAPISVGSVGTIFFRGYWDTSTAFTQYGGNDAMSVATSDLTPAQMGTESFSQSANTFGFFGEPDPSATFSDLSPGVWYNFWVIVDNNADTASYYLSTGNQVPTTPLQYNGVSAFPFSNTPTTAIQTLAFDDHLFIDDVYEDPSTVDLSDPVPEPSCLGMVAAAGILLVRRRRR